MSTLLHRLCLYNGFDAAHSICRVRTSPGYAYRYAVMRRRLSDAHHNCVELEQARSLKTQLSMNGVEVLFQPFALSPVVIG